MRWLGLEGGREECRAREASCSRLRDIERPVSTRSNDMEFSGERSESAATTG